VTAPELFAALTALPGARPVPVAGDGIVESYLVNGVEIAHARDPDERELRRLWRGRFGGGATPLLLIADNADQEQTLRALGPTSHEGPLRVVGTSDLLRALEQLPTRSRLEAVRGLAEELERLDRTGVPGVQARGLGTIFADFTLDAVPESDRVREQFHERAPRMGQRGWLPDHTAERRAEYRRTTPGQRVAETIAVSRTATKLAAIGHERRAR
jgi:hypothetical protein